MCGISGFIDLKRRFEPEELRTVSSRMTDSLSHRGPDDHGVWTDTESGVALGHTRLAIIDLSSAGAQPMVSSCGRFVLSYNGEVYNAPELRAELAAAGRPFRGHSDTEVMVEGFAVWGVRPTIERLIGMFAFATWDRSTHRLTLGRDRLGIKPLYWGRLNGSLVFASELKALNAFPGWQGRDRPRRARGVPALRLCADADEYLSGDPQARARYPSRMRRRRRGSSARRTGRCPKSPNVGRASLLEVSDAAAQEILESLLADAVRRRMVADVPLGMFLSGGINSSTVAALMQANSSRAHSHLLDRLPRAGL